MDSQFRFFRINPFMDLWNRIKEIRTLEKEGVLEEECPSPDYWEFRVKEFEKMPQELVDEIIRNNCHLT